METENKNGVILYSDFEVEKAFKQYKYGVPIADFFRYEAKAYRYGKIGYLGKLREELENFEESQGLGWDIEGMYEHNCKCMEELRKAILDLQDLNTQPPAKKFETNLTDTQRGKLFDLLVDKGFIPNNDKEGFIWAFGGVNDKYTSYSTEWLKTKNLAVYLIDNLCPYTTNLWATGERIFGIADMAQKKNYYTGVNKTMKPKNYNIIDEIISEAKK
jgi:hypothetical protein